MAVALVLHDPIHFNYHETVIAFLKQLESKVADIDVYFLHELLDSIQLNLILTSVYSTIRDEATKLGWDYSLQINVLCNQFLTDKLGDYAKIFASEDIELNAIPSSELNKISIIKANIPSKQEYLPNYEHHLKNQYNVVACGGTFDHLHDGHKILLSMTAFLTSKTVIIGITGPKLLEKKSYAEVLELFEQRETNVKKFLDKLLFNKKVKVDVYEINDICGPTGYIKEIDALVVSEETVKGGAFVNDYRSEKGFPSLEVVIIDVIGSEESGTHNNWAGKLSSTDIREIVFNKRKGN